MQDSTVDKQMIVRLEAKIRDLESRFELEQTTRHRVEVGRTNIVLILVTLAVTIQIIFIHVM